ncbi:MAG: hypothetical protein HY591_05765, partial [Candidatus Omnitrophica bacterium]|nr:hypothetical protein [Candidatus Omnitrophota bacterium]
ILAANNINRSLEELSVLTVAVDLISDIIKVGEPKLKTTLFAMHKVGDALGLKYFSVKVAPRDVLKLKTPFIAHLKGEHFVTVKKVTTSKVYVLDLGRPEILNRVDLEKQVDGFAYVATGSLPAPEMVRGGRYQYVPETLEAFVWGDKWRDQSKNLPGLFNGTRLAVNIGIQVAVAAASFGLGASGVPGFSNTIGGVPVNIGQFVAFGMAVSQFTSTIATICVQEGACDAHTGFLLSTALAFGITVGVGMAGSISNAGTGAAGSFSVGKLAEDLAISLFRAEAQYQVLQQVEKLCKEGDCSETMQIVKDMVSAIAMAVVGYAATVAGVKIISTFDSSVTQRYGFGKTKEGPDAVTDLADEKATVRGMDKVKDALIKNPNLPHEQQQEIFWQEYMIAMKEMGLGDLAQKAFDHQGDKGYPTAFRDLVRDRFAGSPDGLRDQDLVNAWKDGSSKDWKPFDMGETAKSFKSQLPLAVGEISAMLVRLAALKIAGAKADNVYARAISQFFNSGTARMGESWAGGNGFTGKDADGKQISLGDMILKAAKDGAVRGIMQFGFSALEQSIIGKAPGKSDPAKMPRSIDDTHVDGTSDEVLQYEYRLKQAQFRTLVFLGTAVAGAARELFWEPEATSQNPRTWGTFLNLIGGNEQKEMSGYLTPGLGKLFGTPYLSTFVRTGSWGSINNAIAYSDTLGALSGWTAQGAVQSTNIYNNLKAAHEAAKNGPIGLTRGPGGLLAPDYLGAYIASHGPSVQDQYILALWQQHLIGAPGISPDHINTTFQNAVIDNFESIGRPIVVPLVNMIVRPKENALWAKDRVENLKPSEAGFTFTNTVAGRKEIIEFDRQTGKAYKMDSDEQGNLQRTETEVDLQKREIKVTKKGNEFNIISPSGYGTLKEQTLNTENGQIEGRTVYIRRGGLRNFGDIIMTMFVGRMNGMYSAKPGLFSTGDKYFSEPEQKEIEDFYGLKANKYDISWGLGATPGKAGQVFDSKGYYSFAGAAQQNFFLTFPLRDKDGKAVYPVQVAPSEGIKIFTGADNDRAQLFGVIGGPLKNELVLPGGWYYGTPVAGASAAMASVTPTASFSLAQGFAKGAQAFLNNKEGTDPVTLATIPIPSHEFTRNIRFTEDSKPGEASKKSRAALVDKDGRVFVTGEGMPGATVGIEGFSVVARPGDEFVLRGKIKNLDNRFFDLETTAPSRLEYNIVFNTQGIMPVLGTQLRQGLKFIVGQNQEGKNLIVGVEGLYVGASDDEHRRTFTVRDYSFDGTNKEAEAAFGKNIWLETKRIGEKQDGDETTVLQWKGDFIQTNVPLLHGWTKAGESTPLVTRTKLYLSDTKDPSKSLYSTREDGLAEADLTGGEPQARFMADNTGAQLFSSGDGHVRFSRYLLQGGIERVANGDVKGALDNTSLKEVKYNFGDQIDYGNKMTRIGEVKDATIEYIWQKDGKWKPTEESLSKLHDVDMTLTYQDGSHLTLPLKFNLKEHKLYAKAYDYNSMLRPIPKFDDNKQPNASEKENTQDPANASKLPDRAFFTSQNLPLNYQSIAPRGVDSLYVANLNHTGYLIPSLDNSPMFQDVMHIVDKEGMKEFVSMVQTAEKDGQRTAKFIAAEHRDGTNFKPEDVFILNKQGQLAAINTGGKNDAGQYKYQQTYEGLDGHKAVIKLTESLVREGDKPREALVGIDRISMGPGGRAITGSLRGFDRKVEFGQDGKVTRTINDALARIDPTGTSKDIDTGTLIFWSELSKIMPAFNVFIRQGPLSAVASQAESNKNPNKDEQNPDSQKSIAATRAHNYVVSRTKDKEAQGQRIDVSLGANFTGGMSLDQRHMIYENRTGKPLSDFAVVVDEKHEITGELAMRGGNGQRAYFNDKGDMFYGTGIFGIRSNKDYEYYVNHVYNSIAGAKVHGGYTYRSMEYGYRTDGSLDVKSIATGDPHFEWASGRSQGRSSVGGLTASGGKVYLSGVGNAPMVPVFLSGSGLKETDKDSKDKMKSWEKEQPWGKGQGDRPPEADVVSLFKQHQKKELMANDKSINGQLANKYFNQQGHDAKTLEEFHAWLASPDGKAAIRANLGGYYHETTLTGGGMASGQNLISTLHSPFSGSLQQDQRGMVIINEGGQGAAFAKVAGHGSGTAYADNHALIYFDKEGRMDYFTGQLTMKGKIPFVANARKEDGSNAYSEFLFKVIIFGHSLVSDPDDNSRRIQLDFVQGTLPYMVKGRGVGSELRNEGGKDRIVPITFSGIEIINRIDSTGTELQGQGDLKVLDVQKASWVGTKNSGGGTSAPGRADRSDLEKTTTKMNRDEQKKRQEFDDAHKTDIGYTNMSASQKDAFYLAEKAKTDTSLAGQVAKDLLSQSLPSGTDLKAKFNEMYAAKLKEQYDQGNLPNAHTSTLSRNKYGTVMADTQQLILSANTPFSGSMRQDQKNLHVVITGDNVYYGHAVDSHDNHASKFEASNGSDLYYNKDGQLEYFSGNVYLKNIDGKQQVQIYSGKDYDGKIWTLAYLVKSMGMTYSFDRQGLHLDILEQGLDINSKGGLLTNGTTTKEVAFKELPVLVSRSEALKGQGDLRFKIDGDMVYIPAFLRQPTTVDSQESLEKALKQSSENYRRDWEEQWKKRNPTRDMKEKENQDAMNQSYGEHLRDEHNLSFAGLIAKYAQEHRRVTVEGLDLFLKEKGAGSIKNFHEIVLHDNGTAKDQWLIGSLQNPLTGSLSQDQAGLMIQMDNNYNTGGGMLYAKILDAAGNHVANMAAPDQGRVYFDQNGQLGFFTGTNYRLRVSDLDAMVYTADKKGDNPGVEKIEHLRLFPMILAMRYSFGERDLEDHKGKEKVLKLDIVKNETSFVRNAQGTYDFEEHATVDGKPKMVKGTFNDFVQVARKGIGGKEIEGQGDLDLIGIKTEGGQKLFPIEDISRLRIMQTTPLVGSFQVRQGQIIDENGARFQYANAGGGKREVLVSNHRDPKEAGLKFEENDDGQLELRYITKVKSILGLSSYTSNTKVESKAVPGGWMAWIPGDTSSDRTVYFIGSDFKVAAIKGEFFLDSAKLFDRIKDLDGRKMLKGDSKKADYDKINKALKDHTSLEDLALAINDQELFGKWIVDTLKDKAIINLSQVNSTGACVAIHYMASDIFQQTGLGALKMVYIEGLKEPHVALVDVTTRKLIDLTYQADYPDTAKIVLANGKEIKNIKHGAELPQEVIDQAVIPKGVIEQQMALINLKMGRFEEAAKHADKAKEAGGDKAHNIKELADIYIALGNNARNNRDRTQAVQFYEKAKALDEGAGRTDRMDDLDVAISAMGGGGRAAAVKEPRTSFFFDQTGMGKGPMLAVLSSMPSGFYLGRNGKASIRTIDGEFSYESAVSAASNSRTIYIVSDKSGEKFVYDPLTGTTLSKKAGGIIPLTSSQGLPLYLDLGDGQLRTFIYNEAAFGKSENEARNYFRGRVNGHDIFAPDTVTQAGNTYNALIFTTKGEPVDLGHFLASQYQIQAQPAVNEDVQQRGELWVQNEKGPGRPRKELLAHENVFGPMEDKGVSFGQMAKDLLSGMNDYRDAEGYFTVPLLITNVRIKRPQFLGGHGEDERLFSVVTGNGTEGRMDPEALGLSQDTIMGIRKIILDAHNIQKRALESLWAGKPADQADIDADMNAYENSRNRIMELIWKDAGINAVLANPTTVKDYAWTSDHSGERNAKILGTAATACAIGCWNLGFGAALAIGAAGGGYLLLGRNIENNRVNFENISGGEVAMTMGMALLPVAGKVMALTKVGTAVDSWMAGIGKDVALRWGAEISNPVVQRLVGVGVISGRTGTAAAIGAAGYDFLTGHDYSNVGKVASIGAALPALVLPAASLFKSSYGLSFKLAATTVYAPNAVSLVARGKILDGDTNAALFTLALAFPVSRVFAGSTAGSLVEKATQSLIGRAALNVARTSVFSALDYAAWYGMTDAAEAARQGQNLGYDGVMSSAGKGAIFGLIVGGGFGVLGQARLLNAARLAKKTEAAANAAAEGTVNAARAADAGIVEAVSRPTRFYNWLGSKTDKTITWLGTTTGRTIGGAAAGAALNVGYEFVPLWVSRGWTRAAQEYGGERLLLNAATGIISGAVIGRLSNKLFPKAEVLEHNHWRGAGWRLGVGSATGALLFTGHDFGTAIAENGTWQRAWENYGGTQGARFGRLAARGLGGALLGWSIMSGVGAMNRMGWSEGFKFGESPLELWNTSNRSAMRWPIVSANFTIGEAFWTGLVSNIEKGIGDRLGVQTRYTDVHIPAFAMKEGRYFIDLFGEK